MRFGLEGKEIGVSRHHHSLWLALACLLFVSVPRAFAAIKTSEALQTSFVLSGQVLLLEDQDGQLSYQAIREFPDERFEPAQGKVPNFSFTFASHWARFILVNDSSVPESLVLEYTYSMADFVDIYIENAKGQRWQLNSGDRVTSEVRPMRHRFPALRFEIEAKEAVTVHIRVKTQGVNQIPLKLSRFDSFEDRRLTETSIWTAIMGAIFAIFVYNFSLFVTKREKLIFYYLLFVSMVAPSYLIMQGMMHILFWQNDNSLWSNELAISLGGFGSAFGIYFTYKFLEIKRSEKILCSGFLVFIAISLLQGTVVFYSYNVGAKLGGINMLGAVLVVLAASLKRLYRGKIIALYFVMAWSFYILGSVSYSLTLVNVLPVTSLTQYYSIIGLAAENIFLSLAIGYKLRKDLTDTLVHNNNMNLEIEKQNLALTKLTQDLRHEISAKVDMVTELAHRGNNPLHASNLYLDSVQGEFGKLRDLIQRVLGDPQHLDADGKMVYQRFLDGFTATQQGLDGMKNGLKKTARAISEIRALSGVDGVIIETVKWADLVESLNQRLDENLGPRTSEQPRLALKGSHDSALKTSKVVLTIGLERLLRQILIDSSHEIDLMLTEQHSLADSRICLSFFYRNQERQIELSPRAHDILVSLSYLLQSLQCPLQIEDKTGKLIILKAGLSMSAQKGAKAALSDESDKTDPFSLQSSG